LFIITCIEKQCTRPLKGTTNKKNNNNRKKKHYGMRIIERSKALTVFKYLAFPYSHLTSYDRKKESYVI